MEEKVCISLVNFLGGMAFEENLNLPWTLDDSVRSIVTWHEKSSCHGNHEESCSLSLYFLDFLRQVLFGFSQIYDAFLLLEILSSVRMIFQRNISTSHVSFPSKISHNMTKKAKKFFDWISSFLIILVLIFWLAKLLQRNPRKWSWLRGSTWTVSITFCFVFDRRNQRSPVFAGFRISGVFDCVRQPTRSRPLNVWQHAKSFTRDKRSVLCPLYSSDAGNTFEPSIQKLLQHRGLVKRKKRISQKL